MIWYAESSASGGTCYIAAENESIRAGVLAAYNKNELRLRIYNSSLGEHAGNEGEVLKAQEEWLEDVRVRESAQTRY